MPKYKTIADEIRAKILNHEYELGQKLPYEYVLCVTYHCNKETMKKALDILVKEGYIIRRRGAGTFVKDTKPENLSTRTNNRSLTIRYKGIKKVTTDVITFEVIPCDAFLADKLHIEEGNFVYHIIRNRSLDDVPYVVEISYIPLALIPNLKIDILRHSLYEYVVSALKLKVQSTSVVITADVSGDNEQQFLGLKAVEPYIQEACISYLSDGSVLEYTMDRFHYKSYEFKTNIISQ